MDNRRLLYSQKDYPLFQNRVYDSREAARSCPRGDIQIVEDLATGLVYNAAFDPALMVYDADYQNEQANSGRFRAHLDEVAGVVFSQMGREGLVEVGCGKGYFLEMLQAAGADIRGFDPAYEGDNPAIQRRYFDPGSGGQNKGVILRHVLEHISDPHSFLTALRESNSGQGLIYIEVPCLDWICRNRAWFDIFYEHVNYFRLTDFHRLFGRVLASGRLFSGQYLCVVADLATLRAPEIDASDRVDFPADFIGGLGRKDRSKLRVIWGGSSKGVIYSLLCERAGSPVDIAIDISPAKQGRYLPATGVEVVAPEEAFARLPPGADITIMNPNYLEEIKALSRNAFTYLTVG
jgi:hypothetical protein